MRKVMHVQGGKSGYNQILCIDEMVSCLGEGVMLTINAITPIARKNCSNEYDWSYSSESCCWQAVEVEIHEFENFLYRFRQ